MQIRKKGIRFQLLRAVRSEERGRIIQELLGSFSMTCRYLEDVPSGILEILTPKEMQQLEVFLKKMVEEEGLAGRKRRIRNSPKAFTKVLAKVAQCDKVEEESFDEDARQQCYLEVYKLISDAMAKDGFGPVIVEMALKSAAKEEKKFAMDEKSAKKILNAWLDLREVMTDQGFTLMWLRKGQG